MAEYYSGAYFISKRRRRGGGRRGVGVLIVMLTLLTAGICLLAVFLPSSSSASPASGQVKNCDAAFYFLCTFEDGDRTVAYDNALSAAARGGAGYLYNDGSYKVVAAVYRREEDANALAAVNDGATCVKCAFKYTADGKDKKALEYVTGEWFDTMYNAATGLERGSLTDAEADRQASAACMKLLRYADSVKNAQLARALTTAGEYSVPTGRTLKSYLRYVAVRAVVLVEGACTNI